MYTLYPVHAWFTGAKIKGEVRQKRKTQDYSYSCQPATLVTPETDDTRQKSGVTHTYYALSKRIKSRADDTAPYYDTRQTTLPLTAQPSLPPPSTHVTTTSRRPRSVGTRAVLLDKLSDIVTVFSFASHSPKDYRRIHSFVEGCKPVWPCGKSARR